ncbi:hypothetical protein [Rufibacter hautae]|nr:hypothetical protein [Rufibacter hautae]
MTYFAQKVSNIQAQALAAGMGFQDCKVASVVLQDKMVGNG